MKKMSASEIVEAETARGKAKSALDDALMLFRRAEGNRNFARGRIEDGEGRVAELAETVKILTKVEQDFAKIPTTVLERLRGRIPSDHGGRSNLQYSSAFPGTLVRDQISGLAAHARQQHEAATRELEQLRPGLPKAEADLAQIAARVEELKLAAA